MFYENEDIFKGLVSSEAEQMPAYCANCNVKMT